MARQARNPTRRGNPTTSIIPQIYAISLPYTQFNIQYTIDICHLTTLYIVQYIVYYRYMPSHYPIHSLLYNIPQIQAISLPYIQFNIQQYTIDICHITTLYIVQYIVYHSYMPSHYPIHSLIYSIPQIYAISLPYTQFDIQYTRDICHLTILYINQYIQQYTIDICDLTTLYSSIYIVLYHRYMPSQYPLHKSKYILVYHRYRPSHYPIHSSIYIVVDHR